MIYLFYKVDKNDIYMIKFIVEAYENMMSVSTVDEASSKIQIAVAPDYIEDAKGIIADLQKTMFMEQVFDDSDVSQTSY